MNVKKEEIGTDSETNENAVPATLVDIDEVVAGVANMGLRLEKLLTSL